MSAMQAGVSLTHLDATKARIAYDGLIKYVDVASELNTDIIIGWIRGSRNDSISKEYYERMLAERLKGISEYAKNKSVKIHVECLNRYEINTFNCGEELISFIDKFALNNTYVHLDTFHMNIEEISFEETFRKCEQLLGYVHVADNTRGYPGSGLLDFARIFRVLDKINYRGFLTLECLPLPDRITAARNSIKFLHELNYK